MNKKTNSMKLKHLHNFLISLFLSATLIGCTGIRPLKNSELSKNTFVKPTIYKTNETTKDFSVVIPGKTNKIKIDLNQSIKDKNPSLSNVDFAPLELNVVSEPSTNVFKLNEKEIKEDDSSLISGKFLALWFGTIILGTGGYVTWRVLKKKENIIDTPDSDDSTSTQTAPVVASVQNPPVVISSTAPATTVTTTS